MLSVRRLRLREVVFPHLLNKSGGPSDSEDPSEIRTVEVRNKFYVSDAARRRIRFRANQTSSCVEVWGWVECAFQTALGVSSRSPICHIRRWPWPCKIKKTVPQTPTVLGLGFSLTALTPRHRLAPPTNVDNGPKTSTTERARQRFLDVERGHRRYESCEERIDCHSGQSCFRRSQ